MRLSKGDGWKKASPQRVAWGAYLLVDDAIHDRISKAAEKAEGRLGMGKKALAYSVAGLGTAATCAVLAPEPLVAAAFAPVGAFAFLIFSRVMKKAMEAWSSGGAIVQNAESMMLKAARLPLLAFGAIKFVQATLAGARGAAAYGIYFSCLAVAAYLASPGNGMLEQARSFFRELSLIRGQQPAEAQVR